MPKRADPPNPAYAKWLQSAFKAHPQKTMADLSRHLGHAHDRARVVKMVDGTRRIQIDELLEIASFFGISPPSGIGPRGPAAPVSIPRAGIIATGMWFEAGSNAHMTGADPYIPAVIDPRYPVRYQISYEIGFDVPERFYRAGDYLICFPVEHLSRGIEAGEPVVVIRDRGGLKQFGLTKAETRRNRIEMAEDGDPNAIVIGVYRPRG